jgi:hypothetical protein
MGLLDGNRRKAILDILGQMEPPQEAGEEANQEEMPDKSRKVKVRSLVDLMNKSIKDEQEKLGLNP